MSVHAGRTILGNREVATEAQLLTSSKLIPSIFMVKFGSRILAYSGMTAYCVWVP
jgi:hypothetical protein